MSVEEGGRDTLSHKTKVTMALVLVSAPLLLYAGALHNRVENLEKTNLKIETDLRDINRKLDQMQQTLAGMSR